MTTAPLPAAALPDDSEILDLSSEEQAQTNGGDLDFGALPHICSGWGCIMKHITGSGVIDLP